MSTDDKKLATCLLLLRISIFIVMIFWTLDKIYRPEHTISIFQNFYFITISGPTCFIIAAIEALILIGFLMGFMKRYTYSLVLLFHTISTVSAFNQYMQPFTEHNLLFFTAWPMLAACIVLFILRKQDTLLIVECQKGSS